MRKMKMPVLIIAMLAMAACERAPQPAEPAPEPESDPDLAPETASEPAPAEASDPTGGLAPPLLTPGENTPPQAPSYEVSIASAAAEHNNALKRCATLPEAVRTQCEQEANAAFADARANLETLRGNQE